MRRWGFKNIILTGKIAGKRDRERHLEYSTSWTVSRGDAIKSPTENIKDRRCMKNHGGQSLSARRLMMCVWYFKLHGIRIFFKNGWDAHYKLVIKIEKYHKPSNSLAGSRYISLMLFFVRLATWPKFKSAGISLLSRPGFAFTMQQMFFSVACPSRSKMSMSAFGV